MHRTLLKSLQLSVPCPASITSLKELLLFYQSTLQGASVKLVLRCFSLYWLLLLTRETSAKLYSCPVLYLCDNP